MRAIHSNLYSAISITILLFCSIQANARDNKGTLSVALENDIFGAGTDKHYTHGTEISYVSDTYVPNWFRRTASWLPFNKLNDDTRFSWSLGQQIYTPDNLEQETLINNDRPYAGWLNLSLGLVTEELSGRIRHVDSLEIILGVVGPKSGAENAQTSIHRRFDATEPMGWDNQLDNEYTGDLRFRRSWILPIINDYFDILPTLGFTLGSSQRQANAGFTLRMGSGLLSDYGPPLIRPSSSAAYYFKTGQSFFWYLFAGAHGRYVDYNIFLDGNRDGNSHSVEKKEWVGDFQAGLVVGSGNWRLSLTNIFRTREFESQIEPDEFGSLAISYRF